MVMCIKKGVIYTMEERFEPFVGDILVEKGKIIAIGHNLSGDKVINAEGLSVYPGFIDAHSHLGMEESGIGYEGNDVNEKNDILTPHLRAIDAIQPMDPTFSEALQAGVTCVGTGPGSANVVGGTFAAIKTVGHRIDDMIVNPMVAMKCAFGENPKRVYKSVNNGSRMTTAAKLRELLFKAREYEEKLRSAGDDPQKKPAFDMKLHAMLPVLEKKIPLKAHAHRADDIFTALRIAKEFDVNITLEHVTEGHFIAQDLSREQVPLAVGPSLGHATKFELREKSFKTPGILAKAGCQVSIITDSPVIPQCYLPLCAGLAVQSGMDYEEALKAITIHPAKHLGIESRVGTITVGKDADLVITDGDPFVLTTRVCYTIVNGQIYYQAEL